MRRIIYFLIILSIMLLACSIATTATPQAAISVPSVTLAIQNTATMPVTDLPAITPEPSVTTPANTSNVICNELAFYLDPTLASGYNCEKIPESPEGLEVYPEYTNLTLQGYPLEGKFLSAHISVLPIQRYQELRSEFISNRISKMQALTNGGATGDSLPFLPGFNAAQIFHAQYRVLSFASGSGIRFLTEYAQYNAPIDNYDLFYTYQGLTSDGNYWISAVLPINNSLLPADPNNPPNGLTWEQFNVNYSTYLADITSQLDSQTFASFTPNLAALDALVSSITIQP